MDWLKLIRAIIPKVNWPSVVLFVAAMVFYALVLRPDYVTAEQLRAELALHHPALDIKVAVHDTAIDNLKLLEVQREEDIRDLRRNHP